MPGLDILGPKAARLSIRILFKADSVLAFHCAPVERGRFRWPGLFYKNGPVNAGLLDREPVFIGVLLIVLGGDVVHQHRFLFP